ncbi:hypothetical protein DBV15_08508 [Temnothorax longispinosus]|uniref:PDZ domain-containing protein n=1 Tax=Temnothorax longispinosus TaxID=300112 RepID=A0A4S2K4Y1_9HYME|nr:hypothetical protein DBV15_08508 [Temnothorax longispinosus]
MRWLRNANDRTMAGGACTETAHETLVEALINNETLRLAVGLGARDNGPRGGAASFPLTALVATDREDDQDDRTAELEPEREKKKNEEETEVLDFPINGRSTISRDTRSKATRKRKARERGGGKERGAFPVSCEKYNRRTLYSRSIPKMKCRMQEETGKMTCANDVNNGEPIFRGGPGNVVPTKMVDLGGYIIILTNDDGKIKLYGTYSAFTLARFTTARLFIVLSACVAFNIGPVEYSSNESLEIVSSDVNAIILDRSGDFTRHAHVARFRKREMCDATDGFPICSTCYGSAADNMDTLKVSDEILEVNGRTLENATHNEVIQYIHQDESKNLVAEKLGRSRNSFLPDTIFRSTVLGATRRSGEY